MLEISSKLPTFAPSYLTVIVLQNAEIRTVAKSLPKSSQSLDNSLQMQSLHLGCLC